MNREQAFAQLDVVIATASTAERPALVVALAARLATVGAGMTPPAEEAVPSGGGENITIAAAARRQGVSTSYLYRNAAKLPFIVREGRRRLVNVAALDGYNRRGGTR